MNTVERKLNTLIAAYNKVIKGIDAEASMSQERAYGGIVRAGKGKLVENLAHHLVPHISHVKKWNLSFSCKCQD